MVEVKNARVVFQEQKMSLEFDPSTTKLLCEFQEQKPNCAKAFPEQFYGLVARLTHERFVGRKELS